MKPTLIDGNVRANCPTCGGAVTTFEYASGPTGMQDYGTVHLASRHLYAGESCSGIVYKLLRCAGCGRGALAEIHVRAVNQNWGVGILEHFYPYTIEKYPLPSAVPTDLKSEFEEAELCASVEAWRAASALLRSVLEKALKANGYNGSRDNLKTRIDQACADGVMTEARSRRAHDNIRVLGNDILHDQWRAVMREEFNDAHIYAQRILEDFYDDRPTVEATLRAKGRIP